MKVKEIISKKLCITIFLILFVLLQSTSYAYDRGDRLVCDTYYERGVRFYKHAEYQRAQEEFQRIMAACPNYKKTQQYLSAAKKKQEKETIFSLYDEAKKYQQQKDYQKALDAYRAVLEIVPQDGYALHHSTLLEYKINKKAKKHDEQRLQNIEALDKVITEEKNSTRLDHLKAGISLYKEGDYDKAIEEFQIVLKERPVHARARSYLDAAQKKKRDNRLEQLCAQADDYGRERKYQDAIDAYQEASDMLQDSKPSLFALEKVKAKIDKMKWLQENDPLYEQEVGSGEEKKGTPSKSALVAQEIDRLEERIEKEAVDMRSRIPPTSSEKRISSQEMDNALEEAQGAMQQKEKRITELVTSAPSPAIDDEYRMIKELKEQEQLKEAQRVYAIGMEHFQNEQYAHAINSFKQVIVLEHDLAKKLYTADAQRHMERAQQQLVIEQELSSQ